MATFPLAILGTLLGVACAGDVAQRRIPNAVVGALALAGLAFQWSQGGPRGLLDGGAAGALAFGLLFLPWRFGVVGGGDLKLIAAVAIWIGLGRLATFGLLTGAAGLPVALATMAAVHLGRRRSRRAGAAEPADRRPAPRATVPVAVAVALGALVTLTWEGPWPT